MNPVRWSLRHSQVTLVLTGMLFALGVYALWTMPRREDPKITIHTGIVAALYPGAGAEEVESQVTRKIEERLFRFAEVRKEKTFSTSRNGIVYINVELEDFVTDTDGFWSKLRHDMNQLRATELPEGVRGPVVDSDFGDTVAVLIAIHGGHYGYRELKEYAQRVETELRGLRAVSKIRRLGDQSEVIEIASSLERLSQYAVNPVKVIQALQGRNTVQFAGTVPAGPNDVPIDASGAFQTEDQIRQVMIDMSPTGQPVYIGDIASVERVYRDPSQYARLNGARAILLAVEMQEGNNIVEFGDALRDRLASVRPLLPPDLQVDLLADQPSVVAHRINEFIREFGIAIGAVILVTVLLLPIRVAVISALAIPVTVAITFALLNAFGVELHQVSISALIVVLGMVVDDAIVIADNYVELLDRGLPVPEAAWRSATELAVPVLTATLTIIGSFLPLLLLSGAVGEFIRALPIAVAIALGSSYVVAMLLTPVLARFFIRKGLHGEPESGRKRRRSPLDLMQSAYHSAMQRALNHRGLVLAGAAAAFGLGFLILRLVPEQFFPSAERNQFVIDVWTPEGTRIEATDDAVKRIETVLRSEALVAQYAAFLGSSAPRFYYNVNPQPPASNYAQILVNTRSEDGTPELIFALRERLRHAAPEARVFVKELQQGNVMEAPVEVRISGSELQTLRALGAEVENILRRTPGAIDLHHDWHEDAYQLKVNVREEVANRLGLTNASIARQLAGGFEGMPVTTYWEGDRDVHVVLRVDEARRQSFENVADTYVMSLLTGARVPLGTVAELRPEWEPARIVRRNGVRTLTVRAFAGEHHLPSEILASAREPIANTSLPAGYRIEYGGEYENQRETFAEMVHALAISLLAIFIILLFQFRSVSGPLIVMAAIPLALPGAALGLFLTRNPFGFTGFMGIVSLGGVVVRNAIILLDYMQERVEQGVPLETAAREAGERRLRPIFLTTMAAAVGVTPMILSGSSLWSPLASAIAFGLIVSMFFTLIVIPVLYVTVHRRASVPAPAAIAMLSLCLLPPLGAEPRTITLSEAVELAAKQNSLVRLARFKVREAEARVGGVRANYFPQIANETNGLRLAELQRLDIPRGSLGVYPSVGPIPGAAVPIPLGKQNFLLSTTTLTQPLTHLFRIRAGEDVARSDVEIAREEARRAENEVAAKVKELYYGMLIAQRRRAALELQIQAGEERLREAGDAVEAGAALRLQVLEGRARLAEARHGLQTLSDTLADLTLEFNDLVGLPLDTEPQLTPPEPHADPGGDSQRLIRDALDRNPEIRAAVRTVEKARAGLRAARAEYIPEVGGFVQHVYQSGVPLLSRNNAIAGLRMNWTLFEWGKRRAVVRERETQLAAAEENLRRQRNRTLIDVEKNARRVRRADLAIQTAREALAARAEARRVAGDQLEAEVVSVAAFREAEAGLALAEAEVFQQELQRSIAVAELQRTAGAR